MRKEICRYLPQKKKRRLTLYTNYESKLMISIFRDTFMETDSLHFEEQNE